MKISDEEINHYANIFLTLNGRLSKGTFGEFLEKIMKRKIEKKKKDGGLKISIFFIFFIMISCNCYAEYYGYINNDKLADAIYKAEGGVNTKYPYGVKSINTHGNKEYARKICINSIKSAKKRWTCNDVDFITFLGKTYSPPAINPHWVKNVKSLYKGN